MMITIHGFPANTKYQDVKMLLKQECSLNVFVLDNLVNDSDGTKKVRIGLTDNTEGYNVMKCLDGYRMAGNFVLKAIPIGKAVQGHPQPSFKQSKTGQGYGYTPKRNLPEVVPANSRYRWVRKAEQEPTVSKPPDYGEDSASPSFADDIFDEKSQDIPNESEKDPSNIFDDKSQDIPNDSEKDPSNIFDEKSQDFPNVSENPSNEVLPPETTLSNKARKRQRAKLRDISKLNAAKRRRLYFWLNQGKSFMEARELCEIAVKHIPEYPALKAEKKNKAREIALRRMSPERQARAIKLERLKGRGVPGAPAEPRPRCEPIRVRFVDELGLMSQEKIDMLQDKILELIDAETDANGPSFVGCTTPYGNLLLRCADAQTLEWLENHLPSFQLWEGAQLKIINLSESKPAIGIAYVSDPNLDPHAIINMLKSQNQGFDFSHWWITSMKPDPPAGQIVAFNIDNSSVEKLAETNNILYLGVKKIKIRIKDSKAKAPPGPPSMLHVRQEAKGKIGMPSKGRRGMQPMDQISVPPKGQRGMQPKSRRGMHPMHQMSMLPKGQGGMQPKSQRGMQPMHQMSMLPKGQRGMQPKGQRRMQPMDQMGMLPMGQRDMQPMYQMGMSPMNMGQMRPMDMGYMGQTDMGYMGQMDTGYMGQMHTGYMGQIDTGYMGQMGYEPTGSYYCQPGYFGSGNQPKHYGGGNNHNNRQIQGGPQNNAGHKHKPGKRNKKKASKTK